NFVDEIVNMERAGVRTFLEVGPGSTLARLVEAILSAGTDAPEGRPWFALALDASGGKRSGIHDLALALARLAALGHPVDLTPWQRRARPLPAPPARDRKVLTVPICGANYVKPKPGRPPMSATPPRPEPVKTTGLNPVARPT